MVPDAAVKHYRHIQGLQGLAVMAASDLWSEVGLSDLSGSWARHVPAVVSVVSGIQAKAAAAGASYGAATLAQQGLYEAPRYFVDPQAFAGVASDGRSLAGLLYAPVPHTKALIAGGMEPAQALEQGGKLLTTLTRTQVADAGRGAAGVDMATRKNTGFIRMLNPPSCSRCSILAGRFYRWNTGFDRHPRCDCIHVQTSVEAAKTEGLMHDPYEYFHSLSPEDQDRVYTKAGAQAVRDGGDIFQVVNSRRGMKPGGLLTTEGTSKRGNFGKNGPRLTPEAIYGKGLSRAETLKELERYGYILPGGQNPLGVIRGQAEGFGQLGRGGTRVGAREAVLRARETGVRDPLSRATMTAAERRAFDAQANWDAVQAGRDPFTSRKNAPVTPEVAARVELAYRNELARVVQSPRVVREAVDVQSPVVAEPKIVAGKMLTDPRGRRQEPLGYIDGKPMSDDVYNETLTARADSDFRFIDASTDAGADKRATGALQYFMETEKASKLAARNLLNRRSALEGVDLSEANFLLTDGYTANDLSADVLATATKLSQWDANRVPLGKVYKGIQFDQGSTIEDVRRGLITKGLNFTSVTPDLELAQKYAGRPWKTRSVVLEIDNATGIKLNSVGDHAIKSESLFSGDLEILEITEVDERIIVKARAK